MGRKGREGNREERKKRMDGLPDRIELVLFPQIRRVLHAALERDGCGC